MVSRASPETYLQGIEARSLHTYLRIDTRRYDGALVGGTIGVQLQRIRTRVAIAARCGIGDVVGPTGTLGGSSTKVEI